MTFWIPVWQAHYPSPREGTAVAMKQLRCILQVEETMKALTGYGHQVLQHPPVWPHMPSSLRPKNLTNHQLARPAHSWMEWAPLVIPSPILSWSHWGSLRGDIALEWRDNPPPAPPLPHQAPNARERTLGNNGHSWLTASANLSVIWSFSSGKQQRCDQSSWHLMAVPTPQLRVCRSHGMLNSRWQQWAVCRDAAPGTVSWTHKQRSSACLCPLRPSHKKFAPSPGTRTL